MPTEVRIKVRALHPAQKHVKRTAKRFNVLRCGRRWGKNILGEEHLAIEPAIQGYPVGWFAPIYKDMTESFVNMARILDPLITRKDGQQMRIELMTGGVIECWTMENIDAGRGRKYKRVIVDEAAKAKNLAMSWNGSIRPTLTDYVGDAFFLSTPRGFDYFKTLWDMGQDSAFDEWMSWHYPTAANPHILASEIEAARTGGSPEWLFKQEYLAEFVDPPSAVFRGADIDRVIDQTVDEWDV